MNDYQNILEETYIETLENLAFVFSDKIDEDEAREMLTKDEYYLTSMEFTGGLEGNLKLATEKELGAIVAENMLGSMQDENGDLFIDSLKEITNVICGKLVTEIAGTEPIVDLSIPEVAPYSKEECQKLVKNKNSIIFNSEEFLVVLNCQLKK